MNRLEGKLGGAQQGHMSEKRAKSGDQKSVDQKAGHQKSAGTDPSKPTPGKVVPDLPTSAPNSAASTSAPFVLSPVPVVVPHAATGDNSTALLALLRLEADLREPSEERQLVLLIANETRKLTRARQVFVCRATDRGGFDIIAISSLATVDRNAPLTRAIEVELAALGKSGGFAEMRRHTLDVRTADAGDPLKVYPFRELLWLPLKLRDGTVFAGVLLAREQAWPDADLAVPNRLGAAFAHTWAALVPGRRLKSTSAWKRYGGIAATLAALAALACPVPMTALAPLEIVAFEPAVVAAPIDGVVEEIVVPPSTRVKSGDLLLKLADTALRNRAEIAEREVRVAEARLKQATQLAFNDMRGRHDLGIAGAELALKMAERDYAKDMLLKSEVRAPRDGVVIYSDKRDLIGKPVSTGERLMEIADPEKIEARVDLPVADVISLAPSARVKLFLDSDPLHPFEARAVRTDYKARPVEGDALAFRVMAVLEQAGRGVPRLGVRGTAQVHGETVPLGLFLLRRPLSALRQWVGI